MPDYPADGEPDLQKQYEKQKDVVNTAQNTLTEATKDLALQQGTLRELQTRVNEISQATAGYDKTLQDRLDQSQKTAGEKLDNAKAALKDLTDKIDGIVQNFDKDLTAQKEAVKNAKGDSDQAAKDAEKAVSDLQSAQADLDAAKKLPRTIDASLQEIKALLDQVAKSESQNDYVAVYFLASEAKSKAGALNIPTATDYTTMVTNKEAAVNKAKEDVKNKKAAAAGAQDSYTKLQQKYDAATKTRQADILSALKAVHPKAA